MSARSKRVLDEALGLSPVERAELVEQILSSFDFACRDEIDALWAREAEDRIDAHDGGRIRSTPADEVFQKVDRQGPR